MSVFPLFAWSRIWSLNQDIAKALALWDRTENRGWILVPRSMFEIAITGVEGLRPLPLPVSVGGISNSSPNDRLNPVISFTATLYYSYGLVHLAYCNSEFNMKPWIFQRRTARSLSTNWDKRRHTSTLRTGFKPVIPVLDQSNAARPQWSSSLHYGQ
jgi:hypothetical protein